MAEQAYTVVSESETTTGEEKSASPFPETAIGIDIGTSQSKVAIWTGTQVELLKNNRNQKLIRSYVNFKDEIPFGGASDNVCGDLEILSGSSIFNLKRLIGRIDTDPVIDSSKYLPFLVQTLGIGSRPFIAALVNNMWRSTTPEEVLAIFLVELRAMAEARLNRTVRNVVLTVPVTFSRFQLTRIERACAMAGLHVLRLMPEPTVVALLYAQQQQTTLQENMGSGSEKIALIFNMGAGFCDVAVTATAGGVSQIKALAGAALGAEDMLQNVMYYLVPSTDELFSSFHGIRARSLLRIAAQDVVHRISSQNSVQIDVDLQNGTKIQKIINRDEFERINGDVFDKCESLINRCLREAKMEPEDVNDVILVGGCSNIPKIRNILKNIFKREELYSEMNPIEAAVRGAALEGAVASGVGDPFGSLDLLTIQATPMSIGIRATGENGDFVPIIHRNMTIPARKEAVFTTVNDDQAEALIIVLEEGEGKNHLLGYFKILGIPKAPKGVPEINVCMDIDASNVLRVLAGVLMPSSKNPVGPFVEVRMPTVDDGHGWCVEALNRAYGSSLDLVSLQKKVQK